MIGLLIGGIASLVGSAVSSATSAADSRKAREWQSEENNIQRNWQRQMMYEQNELNVENWQREMEYNTPVNQVNRLKAAGLNADLAYSSLSSGSENSIAGVSQATTSPSTSAANAVPDRSYIANAVSSAANIAKQIAETKKAKSDARKAESEADLNEIEKQFRPKLYQQTLDINDVQIKVLGANLAKTEEETKFIKQQIAESVAKIQTMQEQAELFKAQASFMSAQEIGQSLENAFKSATFDAEIDRVYTELEQAKVNLGISKEELKVYALYRAAQIANIKADTNLKYSQSNLNKSQEWLNRSLHEGQVVENKLKSQGYELNEYQLDAARYSEKFGFLSRRDLSGIAYRMSLIGQALTLGLSGAIGSLFKLK